MFSRNLVKVEEEIKMDNDLSKGRDVLKEVKVPEHLEFSLSLVSFLLPFPLIRAECSPTTSPYTETLTLSASESDCV